jgi:phenylacetate-coenzyme A ligase PaaK-like adenylate-forming protein
MEDKIFCLSDSDFEAVAIDVFHFQYELNPVYRLWVDTLGIRPCNVASLKAIPFLPISFLKTHKVVTTNFQPEIIFESSGTTGMVNSKHYIKSLNLYQQSFLSAFEYFYGPPDQFAILALLPGYLERKHSSLVHMVTELIHRSKHPSSGFFLRDLDALEKELEQLVTAGQKILLIGVTFALLDFAEAHPIQLNNAIVMETGGMKGRREELTREELHSILKQKLGVENIHSEYGMTELLSQAYSKADGVFQTPPWMKVVIRDEEDPLQLKNDKGTLSTKGLINIIDLANLYSCAFIATDDLGSLSSHGFTVDGRLDSSDLRGCSLLTVS